MTITIITGITAVAISSSSSSVTERTITSGTTLLSTDNYVYVNNTTAAPMSVTLPVSPGTNQLLIIKDVADNAATFNITIVGTVDGAVNPVIGANYGGAGLAWTGSAWSEIF